MKYKGRILIVDDSKVYQKSIQGILSDYETLLADDGLEALDKLIEHSDIEVVVLDINMPKLDGFQVLQHINDHMPQKNLSIIILTSKDEIENEIKGLELGAVDYIRKPFNNHALKKRIDLHMNLISAKKEIELHSRMLEELVDYRTCQLKEARDVTISALVSLLEVRDVESANHTIRTKEMIKELCKKVSYIPSYRKLLTQRKIDLIYRTAPLHDIGKVGVPDAVLLKPGKLTVMEFEEIKKHVNYGINALLTNKQAECDNGYIRTAIRLIGGHHERYDGTGYPNGLKGEEIPLEGRLMAVVDVYDALRSKRVYKEAYDHEKTMEIMRAERGKHFDPVIFDAFEEIEFIIQEISRRYNDYDNLNALKNQRSETLTIMMEN